MTSALFSPIRLAGLELANRIVVAPMCQYSADDGVGNDWHMTHLGMLANSGAGMLVIEATHVERRGRITHGCLGLYSDACEAALERVVYHCHHIGTAKIAIQLAHAGRKASSARPWEGAKALTAAGGCLADHRAIGAAVRAGLAYARRHDRGRHGARQLRPSPTPPSARCASASMPSSCISPTAFFPEESKYPGDDYKLRATVPAEEAFRPMKDDNCPMVTN